MSKEGDSDGILIADLVQEMMERPLGGRPIPSVLKVNIQNQKLMVQRVFDEILAQVAEGKSVKIKNFGTFSQREVRANARNPQTGGVVEPKGMIRLRLSPSDNATDTLNKLGK